MSEDAQHAPPVRNGDGNGDNSTPSADLTSLSPPELIARITELESRLKATTAQLTALASNSATAAATVPDPAVAQPPPTTSLKTKKAPRPFDFSRYSTRHIALKFAYLGHRYNGLEHANGGLATLRPTVEEALWKALRKARLIPPDVALGCDGTFDVVYHESNRRKMYWDEKLKLEIDWTGLQYSKCGRTDKGVSAFGQVVGLNVRSNKPKRKISSEGEQESENEQCEFDGVKDELPYIAILNSVLPSDIKILAWCPNPGPTFDARFSCRERRYKYFFTNPAFCPMPGTQGLNHASGEQSPVREGWLDIEAMRKAAKKLEGLHDFRNFCKIDVSKQMSSCERRITFADIEEMPSGMDRFVTDPQLAQPAGQTRGADGNILSTQGPKVYAFAVHGTAFLWHQVRCMVAILFLVGQGLEKPEIVDELLDIAQNPGRPHYEMADDASLVLWDCVFPGDQSEDENGLNWIHAGDEASIAALTKKGDSQYDGKFGIGGLVTDLWQEWRNAKMKETLTAGLLGLALGQGDSTSLQRGGFRTGADPKFRSQRIFIGGDFAKNIGDYTPIMKKERMETLEVQNAKYLAGKQARRDLKKSQVLNDE